MDRRIVIAVALAAVGMVVAVAAIVSAVNHEPEQQELRFETTPTEAVQKVSSNAAVYQLVFAGDAEFVGWNINGDVSYRASPTCELQPGVYDIECKAYMDGFTDTSRIDLTVEEGDYDIFSEYSRELTLLGAACTLIGAAACILEVSGCRV